MSEGTAAQLPLYNCHKQVHALKIANIEKKAPTIDELEAILKEDPNRKEVIGATITPAEEGLAPFTVSQEFIMKHRPEVGGYYVVYKDGYTSFSPAQAFEEGYTSADTKIVR